MWIMFLLVRKLSRNWIISNIFKILKWKSNLHEFLANSGKILEIIDARNFRGYAKRNRELQKKKIIRYWLTQITIINS